MWWKRGGQHPERRVWEGGETNERDAFFDGDERTMMKVG